MNIRKIIEIAQKAGEAILEVYQREFSVEQKEDKSPLTEADRRAHEIIQAGLSENFPDVPVLSEEGREILYAERQSWKRLFIVDPLDGTREFINKNGDFTVNIALVEEGVPVLGVVHVPVTGETYIGSDDGAYYIAEGSKIRLPDPEKRGIEQGVIRVVASRSHMTEETERFIAELEQKHGTVETTSRGSSLKLCMVASGEADVYPRLAPTMEWDTAAAQAVVEAAGGRVVEYETGMPLRYNREDLLNPWFVVEGIN